MILIDSNIFIIDRFFKRDEHYGINKEFVAELPDLSVSTSIYNLFEICGLASFNLSPEELDEWFYHFDQLYALDILYPRNLDRSTRQFFQDLTAEMFRLFVTTQARADFKPPAKRGVCDSLPMLPAPGTWRSGDLTPACDGGFTPVA